jgi:hypothetical protein
VTYFEIVSLYFEFALEYAEGADALIAQTTTGDAQMALLSASARWCHVLDCGA